MFSHLRSYARLFLGFLLGILLGGAPLLAQIEPKLQNSQTDFLDLYQSSSTVNARPEIVTIFDYSRSMASLMFHPLYRNNDFIPANPLTGAKAIVDGDASDRMMKFQLVDEVVGTGPTPGTTPPDNTYILTATPYCTTTTSNCDGTGVVTTAVANAAARVQYQIKFTSAGPWGGAAPAGSWTGTQLPAVNGATGCPLVAAYTVAAYDDPAILQDLPITITAKAVGDTSASTSLTFNCPAGNNPIYSYASGTNVPHTTYTFTDAAGSALVPTADYSPASGSAGTVITLTVYLKHPFVEGESPTHKDIVWSASGGRAPTGIGAISAPTWTEVSSGFYKSVITWTVPAFTQTPIVHHAACSYPATGGPVQLKPITMSGTMGPGNVLTFNTFFSLLPASGPVNYNKIVWTMATSGNAPCSVSTTVTGSPTTATTISGGSVTWTVPAICTTLTGGSSGTTGTPAYVIATLDPRYTAFPGSVPVPGVTYLTSTLTGRTDTVGYEVLRKPDGNPVTVLDADKAAGLLYRAASKRLDVRNWIRAASHVRFKTNVGSPAVTRTIDLPIPWGIIDPASDLNHNPLDQLTALDNKVVNSVDAFGNPVVTPYGSNTQIEMDSTYKVETGAGGVFTTSNTTPGPPTTAGNSDTKIVYLWTVLYRPAYTSWLFTGKYQNTQPTWPGYAPGAAVGKYIVFDAKSVTSVAGQVLPSWGAGFGPSGTTWGSIQVPRYNSDGTYKDMILRDASGYKIPALTRIQATKKAAIQTWIKHQNEVFWAFRTLDPVEAGVTPPGSVTTIDNNSKTNLAAGVPATTHMNGNDSGWTVLNNIPGVGSDTAVNGNSVKGMSRIASLFAWGSTPLTYAMARTLAQYSDPNSVFNSVVGTDVSQCESQFLLLFTDGVDNNNDEGYSNANTDTPYITAHPTDPTGFGLSAAEGNKAIIAAPTSIDRSGTNWNLFTFAGVGAHLADPSLGALGVGFLAAQDPGMPGAISPTLSGNPSSLLPFANKKRNGITFNNDKRVTTMTVGVSLGGQIADQGSPKSFLFRAAVVGDPTSTVGGLSTYHGFNGWEQAKPATAPFVPDSENDWVPLFPGDPAYWLDPTGTPPVPAGSTAGTRKTGAVYFFDATDADKLSASMDFAFRLAIGKPGNNATASPNLPFIGASFGHQVYIGNFKPPATGGVTWPGDLQMFGTRETAGKISLTDKSGNIAAVLDQSTASWSAAAYLSDPSHLWSSRKLFTRLPGNATVPERGLHAFSATGAAYTNADNTDNTAGLQNYVATAAVGVGTAAQKSLIQNAAGADKSNLLANRSDIMGDIIDSAPSILEYTFTDSVISSGISSTSGLSSFTAPNRFRLLLVGTNQGWLHAFGEVSKFTTVTDSSGKQQEIVQGGVAELWSFMPTDFLTDLAYVYGPTASGNQHKFMVDGTASIYHLDLPPSGGGSGNGTVDNKNATTYERAIAIIGLRKGGRSYYAIDIHDPFKPTLKWSLVPNEAALLPGTRNLTNMTTPALQTLIANMGFSSCTPGNARVAFTDKYGVTKLRDVVFLGGGYSNSKVEGNFLDASGKSILLGRSVLAIDIDTGEILAASDLTKLAGVTVTPGLPSTSSMGPIVAGVVPFEFILNSGMAQRAYFTDYKGALWAWGSKDTVSTGSSKDYRIDTSDLAKWTVDGNTGSSVGIRKVFQSGEGNGALYTTLPAPFKVGSFPGKGKLTAPSPAAVGVALVSGDRNNPTDQFYLPVSTKPDHHRLTVVFDRQDSRAWSLDTEAGPDAGITDSQLSNFTGNIVTANPVTACSTIWKDITPSCPDFYLAPSITTNTKFGYYLNFDSISNTFVPKGINTPSVVAGSLFYTIFKPTSYDPCGGGAGISYTNVVADVISPLAKDTRSGIANLSGNLGSWIGVASDYTAFGTRGVIQGGTVAQSNPPPGGVQTTIEMKTLLGSPKERFPKARVWRTVR
jgi:hypothetical protein